MPETANDSRQGKVERGWGKVESLMPMPNTGCGCVTHGQGVTPTPDPSPPADWEHTHNVIVARFK